MLIAATKLADIAARSLFVLLVLYALPVRSTGQFGLALTLIGFFSFLSGFERYADLQRRMIGTSEQQTDRLIVSTLRFYAGNYLVWSPALIALLMLWAQLPLTSTLLCLLIALGEHLSNEVYRIALIAPRHRPVLFAVLAKNILTLATVVTLLWSRPSSFDIDLVLVVWATTSLVGLLAIAFGFMKTWAFESFAAAGGAQLTQLNQYRSSRTHFMIGLVAMAALQADRLVAGALLSLEQSGLYFRHIFLASFAYQVFNVGSYNRIAPTVYGHAHAGQPWLAKAAIRRELTMLVPLAGLLVGGIYAVDHVGLEKVKALESINPHYLAILVMGYLIRAFADFNALQLNAVYSERLVFIAQAGAVSLAIAVNVVLTKHFGIAGAVVALVLGSTAYLIASGFYTWRSPSLNTRETS
jgi:O-antigen/teichoic acid export membrane protein